MSRTKSPRRGAALIEFTFIGIPLMFVLLSIFEMSRIMWVYNVLAHSVKEAVRYAAVHGNGCGEYPNSCTVTVGDVARRMSPLDAQSGNPLSPRGQGVGLVPSSVRNIRMIWGDPYPADSIDTLTDPDSLDQGYLECTDLPTCLTDSRPFPSGGQYPATGAPGGQWPYRITIRAEYQFRTPLSLFWPGAGWIMFGNVTLPASATELVHY